MTPVFLERAVQLAADFRAIKRELAEVSALTRDCMARAQGHEVTA